jgi:predicted nucleotidyltransferase component of viral defense system
VAITMPMYDKITIGRKARELGFVRDPFEKMSRLTEVLRFIGSEHELNPLLALKGGTAINLTVFNLPRLSVDIDLDFAENLTKAETAVKRERINELIKQYMLNEGYTLKGKSKQSHALDSFVFAYPNAAGSSDNLKIETNYSLRSHVLPTTERMTCTDGTFADFTVRMLDPIEIFASKIVALTERGAARDLYDLNNMVYLNMFNESEHTLLRKCAVYYLAVAGDIGAQMFNYKKLDEITARSIRTDLLPMIRNMDKFDFASAKVRVSDFLHKLLTLSDKESAFLQRFSSGHYEPALLFDDSEILNRIENHPMAVWRIRHIRDSSEK